jgi:3-oxoacyl-[acyl-carrier protein] reductase
MLAIHLDGTFYGTRAAAGVMAPRGRGAIVNMGSICGLEGCTGHPHYSAAKAGIIGFTKAVGKELIQQGVRVNAIAPGHVGTETLQGALSNGRRAIAQATPARRLGRPEDVGALTVYLASDAADMMPGRSIVVDGGAMVHA